MKNTLLRICLILFFFFLAGLTQAQKSSKKTADQQYIEPININVSDELDHFPAHMEGARYFISLCADVPNNKKPAKVAFQQQTGHVFLILQMSGNTNDTTSQVFGFYPKRGLSTLLFKSVKSVIKDNSRREYDAVITKELNRLQFETVISRSIGYASRIYHINKFNCYDYAVLVFNSVAEIPVPITYVRFPFIFGKGGSPVGLYSNLKGLQVKDSTATMIRFEKLIAPVSSTRVIRSKTQPRKLKNQSSPKVFFRCKGSSTILHSKTSGPIFHIPYAT